MKLKAKTREFKRPSFARTLYDGALPLDMVFSGSVAASERPGILSRRGEEEDFVTPKKDNDNEAP